MLVSCRVGQPANRTPRHWSHWAQYSTSPSGCSAAAHPFRSCSPPTPAGAFHRACRQWTQPLALKLLALNGLDPKKLQLSANTPAEGARRLIAGEIDVAVVLSAWDAPVVQQLLHAPGITLMTWRRADAYVALNPKLSKLLLPEGVVDLATNRPPTDVALIASKANLVVRRDLHPALQYLLLRAAMEVHAGAAIFQRSGEFPAPEVTDLPISDYAARIYKSGPSILQRTLPFWLAELVQRLLILVLPLAGIVYPLWSLMLRMYRWQMQQRLIRLYAELRAIKRTVRNAPAPRRMPAFLPRSTTSSGGRRKSAYRDLLRDGLQSQIAHPRAAAAVRERRRMRLTGVGPPSQRDLFAWLAARPTR